MAHELIAPLFALFGGSFFLGAAARPPWRVPRRGGQKTADSRARGVAAAGWLLTLLSVIGFARHFGWEVGLAWFVLWAFLSLVAATLWLSLRPKTTVWVGGLLAVIALGAWVL